MTQPLSLFITTPKGMESLLVDELQGLGIDKYKETRAGVSVETDQETAYRICLWSRLANRVLLKIDEFPADGAEELYQGIYAHDWQQHMSESGNFSVHCTLNRSTLDHTHFAALKAKDGLVDYFRDKTGERPSVELEQPDLRIHIHISNNLATLYLDLAGESLHRRGYRLDSNRAPLKENLAAAILLRADWPAIAKEGGTLLDPMCGSGTLLIEGALMASDSAPGLLRDYFAFLYWKQHKPSLWDALVKEAEQRQQIGMEKLPKIIGFDADEKSIRISRDNIKRAGMEKHIHVEQQELANLNNQQQLPPGLLICNPPYGERLGEIKELLHLYTALGTHLKESFLHWQAGLFTGNPDLGKQMGIRANKRYTLFNGTIECKLLRFAVEQEWFVDKKPGRASSHKLPEAAMSDGMRSLANRIDKNRKRLKSWLKQQAVSCYRIYDADIPEYAFAIDIYEEWVHVQEYAPPKTVDEEKAESRRKELQYFLSEILGVADKNVFYKLRQKQKGSSQYEKLAEEDTFYTVSEGRCKFLVNFVSYLDTGLFLDHRSTRAMVEKISAGKTVLNLFCYTGAVTVHAAVGGAKSTTSIDMSKTYLDWAKRNMALNGFSDNKHQYIQEDCIKWLDTATEKFDLIFLDPPSFSNSKRMDDVLDIQRDHVKLITACGNLLNEGGLLIFSNNLRRFKLDETALAEFDIKDMTKPTIPVDFARSPHIHHCWFIKKPA